MANSAALELMRSIKDITSVTVSGFKYMGKVDKLPEKSNIGDVYSCNGKNYVYNNGWTEMGFTATQPDYPTTVTVEKMKPRLCTQCGAPLHSSKCRFCDTEYC